VQQFGATAPRFVGNRTAFSSTLGPGQYGDFRQSYKPLKKTAHAAFLCNEKKGEEKKLAIETPGPGQYQHKGIKEVINKKVWGKQGAFGSTEKRFAQFTSMVKILYHFNNNHNIRKLLGLEIIIQTNLLKILIRKSLSKDQVQCLRILYWSQRRDQKCTHLSGNMTKV